MKNGRRSAEIGGSNMPVLSNRTADFTDSVIRRMTRISMECLVGLCRKDNGCRAKTKEYGPEGIAYSLKNAKFAGKIYWI